MNSISLGKKKIEMPGEWNELSVHQLKYICENWNAWSIAIDFSTDVFLYFRMKMLFILAGVSRWNPFSKASRLLLSKIPSKKECSNLSDDEFIEKYEHLPAFIELTDLIFKNPVTLTQNKLQKIWTRFGTLHGPGEGLATLIFQEFIFADTFFTNYTANHSKEDLDLFVATLYRPRMKEVNHFSPDYLGDDRKPFNRAAIEKLLPAVKSMKQWEKMAVFFYYMGSRNALEQLYPNVFSKPDPAAVGSSVSNWYNTLSDLPAEKFGTIPEREAMSITTVLQELEKCVVEYINKKP